jgi:nucleoid-associated protein YgaU
LTGLTNEVTQLRADRERMQKMLADAGRQMRDSTADASRIKELEAQAVILAKARDEAQTQNASAQAALAAKNEAPAYPNLTDTVRALEGKVESLQAELAAKPAAPSYPDLSGKVQELEAQVGSLQHALAAKSAAANATPAYPDLSGRVQELEAQVGSLQGALAAKTSAPAYPDLSGRVRELETTLSDTATRLAAEQARAATAQVPATPGVDVEKLQKQLAETEDKLATALRGYALLEKDRDALAASGNKATEAVSAERNALSAQVATLTNEVTQLRAAATAQSEALNQAAALTAEKDSLQQRLTAAEARANAAATDAARANEAVAALQRASAQNTNDLNATRALAQQLQGANSVLATENYQLKTMLSRTVTPTGPATPAPVVAAAPAGRTHVVANGDSLSRISQRYYGASNRWQEIYNANRDKIGNDGVLRVGTELRIP